MFSVGNNFFHVFGFLWVFEGEKTEDGSPKMEVRRPETEEQRKKSEDDIGYKLLIFILIRISLDKFNKWE